MEQQLQLQQQQQQQQPQPQQQQQLQQQRQQQYQLKEQLIHNVVLLLDPIRHDNIEVFRYQPQPGGFNIRSLDKNIVIFTLVRDKYIKTPKNKIIEALGSDIINNISFVGYEAQVTEYSPRFRMYSHINYDCPIFLFK